MSRTYRRKDVPDYVIIRDIDFSWKSSCKGYTDKQTVSKYHRCTRVGYGYSVPKAFCKILNRERRAKDKAETRRILIQGDYEKYQFNAWVKDAGWFCW